MSANYRLPTILSNEPLSYRQMQHWIDRYPQVFSNSAAGGGSGRPRELTRTDVERLRVMARLVAVGFRPDAAAAIAEQGAGYHRLSDRVVLNVKAAIS